MVNDLGPERTLGRSLVPKTQPFRAYCETRHLLKLLSEDPNPRHDALSDLFYAGQISLEYCGPGAASIL